MHPYNLLHLASSVHLRPLSVSKRHCSQHIRPPAPHPARPWNLLPNYRLLDRYVLWPHPRNNRIHWTCPNAFQSVHPTTIYDVSPSNSKPLGLLQWFLSIALVDRELICVTIGPVFLTAAIYLCLSRIIVVYGAHLSRLAPGTIAISFMVSDFISLLLQAGGGAVVEIANDFTVEHIGIHLTIGGLSL
jgi:hypothetical protein